MLTLPISEKSKQKEWKIILTIAKDNGYPSHIIHNLKTKLTGRKQKRKQQQNTEILHKQWVSFTYYSLLIRRITNLFKQTGLKIAFRAASTIQQQLTHKQVCKNPSGIYKLQCNTRNAVYIGQTGRAMNIRHKEHIRYIRTNYPMSAYAEHILQNRHEYGTATDTLQLLQECQKGTRMNCWEALYIQTYHQQKVLIDEQQVYEANPLFILVNKTHILPNVA
jgi:hypothetical protein